MWEVLGVVPLERFPVLGSLADSESDPISPFTEIVGAILDASESDELEGLMDPGGAVSAVVGSG